MDDNLFVFKIQRYSIHDGPGIRTTVFFQGCPLSCWWCHNPESQSMPPKMSAEDSDRIAVNLMHEIKKDQIFYDDSCGGVTFSGGEPLCQPDLLFKLLDLCRENEIHTCIDTSGYVDAELFLKAAEKTNLILYDIKLINEKAHREYTGKDLGPVLDNLKQVSRQRGFVRVRFPLIPQITDTDENVSGIITFLINETRYRDVHILPFHKAGEAKYDSLNRQNYMKNTQPPSIDSVQKIREQFESRGFNVIIGG